MAKKAPAEQGNDTLVVRRLDLHPTAPSPESPGAFDEVPNDPALLGVLRWSFDGVLRRALGFSRAAEHENKASRHAGRPSAFPSTARPGNEPARPRPAFDALRLFVQSLDAEMRGKLRTVMHAGREAQTLPAAVAALAAVRSAGAEGELFAGGAAALQDLQRGHAIACATGFDLELTLDRWGRVREPESLDERVWLRFGRELARSTIEEWSCSAVVDARGRLQKLYLRRGKARWWSFAALIDRPSDSALRVQGSAWSRRSRLVVLPLHSALGRSLCGELRAVRRASMAVSARLGAGRNSDRAHAPPARRKAPA